MASGVPNDFTQARDIQYLKTPGAALFPQYLQILPQPSGVVIKIQDASKLSQNTKRSLTGGDLRVLHHVMYEGYICQLQNTAVHVPQESIRPINWLYEGANQKPLTLHISSLTVGHNEANTCIFRVTIEMIVYSTTTAPQAMRMSIPYATRDRITVLEVLGSAGTIQQSRLNSVGRPMVPMSALRRIKNVFRY